jgi:hypothetical protein
MDGYGTRLQVPEARGRARDGDAARKHQQPASAALDWSGASRTAGDICCPCGLAQHCTLRTLRTLRTLTHWNRRSLQTLILPFVADMQRISHLSQGRVDPVINTNFGRVAKRGHATLPRFRRGEPEMDNSHLVPCFTPVLGMLAPAFPL